MPRHSCHISCKNPHYSRLRPLLVYHVVPCLYSTIISQATPAPMNSVRYYGGTSSSESHSTEPNVRVHGALCSACWCSGSRGPGRREPRRRVGHDVCSRRHWYYGGASSCCRSHAVESLRCCCCNVVQLRGRACPGSSRVVGFVTKAQTQISIHESVAVE